MPEIGSRWVRGDNKFDPEHGEYNGYTVMAITNTEHVHPSHPPQVVYKGDNGRIWSLPLERWPGNLVPEEGAAGGQTWRAAGYIFGNGQVVRTFNLEKREVLFWELKEPVEVGAPYGGPENVKQILFALQFKNIESVAVLHRWLAEYIVAQLRHDKEEVKDA